MNYEERLEQEELLRKEKMVEIEHISLIIAQTECSRLISINALIEANGDILEAIKLICPEMIQPRDETFSW